MAKSLLSGLPAETRKQIREQIKVGRRLAKQQEEQDYDKFWTGLNALKKQIDASVDKAKASGAVPKGTTLKRLTMMPKAKPKRWSSVFKRIFGRKTKKGATENKNIVVSFKAKVKKTSKKRAKTKAKAKKATPKPKSAGAMAVRKPFGGLTKAQWDEKQRSPRTIEQTEAKNRARRLRRALGKSN